MDCLKYGYGYKSFLEFNDYEKGLISDEEYKKAWHDAMEEMTKDQFAQRIKERKGLARGKKKKGKEFNQYRYNYIREQYKRTSIEYNSYINKQLKQIAKIY